MPNLTETIATWDESPRFQEGPVPVPTSISTEAQQVESPAWQFCIDALLETWTIASTHHDPQPNRLAIEAAIVWVAFLRRRFPQDPPTCIIPEPDGGIIVERRGTVPDGPEFLCELTFYNDGTVEWTDCVDGRVLQMISMPNRLHVTNV